MVAKKKSAAKEPEKKKVKAADPLYPSRPRNFRIGGDIQPTKDLGRFVKWPKYVRLQRKKQILYQRLTVPPSVNQFTFALEKNQATSLFKLLEQYRPLEAAQKKLQREAKAGAEAGGEGKAEDIPEYDNKCLRFGIKQVTALVEEKKAVLVCIASDVDPIELVVWLPALCRKMGVPYCIVKNKSRLGALVHQKNATAVALVGVRPGDQNDLRTLCDNFNEQFTEAKTKWGRSGKPTMGMKTVKKLEKRAAVVQAELAKRQANTL